MNKELANMYQPDKNKSYMDQILSLVIASCFKSPGSTQRFHPSK